MSDSYNITDTLILLAVIETSFSEHNADSLLLFETKGDRKKKNLDLPETSRGKSLKELTHKMDTSKMSLVRSFKEPHRGFSAIEGVVLILSSEYHECLPD